MDGKGLQDGDDDQNALNAGDFLDQSIQGSEKGHGASKMQSRLGSIDGDREDSMANFKVDDGADRAGTGYGLRESQDPDAIDVGGKGLGGDDD